MTHLIRLLAATGSNPRDVQFAVAFAAPLAGDEEICAPAHLELGDGHLAELGNLCAPSRYTWREQRRVALGSHSYSGDGPFTARLRWGELTASFPARPGCAVGAGATATTKLATPAAPKILSFEVNPVAESPLERAVNVEATDLAPGQQIRVDGGAGQVFWLSGGGSQTQATKWKLTYSKPGPYAVALDLLDADGFWVATLAETRIEISPPPEEISVEVAPRAVGPEPLIAASPLLVPASRPWLPYDYGRPGHSGVYTYATPGGGVVKRIVGLGTYLSIRAKATAGRMLWYQTGSSDWVPATALTSFRPSELRGVELSGAVPPPPPPPPSSRRRGVVTADVLNVRAQPGVRSDNPPIDLLHAGVEVTVYEETSYAGATWYRIGDGRWVYGEYVRLTGSAEPTPAELRHGIVTASPPGPSGVAGAGLNVRAVPGVREDNPPVDQLPMETEVTIYEEQQYEGIAWYRIGENRWVESRWVRLTSSSARSLSDGAWAFSPALPTRLPIGFVVAASLNVYARPGGTINLPIARVQHNQAVPILDTKASGNRQWYRIGDDRWVDATWVGVARFRPRPSGIGPETRWVGVNLKEQTAVAYEGDRPVYAVLAATGRAGTPTVQGVFRTWRRLPTGKMSGGSGASYYYIEDVTWTCYFYSGYALHTAYWHDAFGRPRSHGCVNLSPYDAWWIYQWSAPGGPNSPAVHVYWS